MLKVTERFFNKNTSAKGNLSKLIAAGEFHYNRRYYSENFESDVILHLPNGELIEFEFKNNHSDFMLDFMKRIGQYTRTNGRVDPRQRRRSRPKDDPRLYKHDLLPAGGLGIKKFYFLCEPGIIDIKKVPEYSGLCHLEVDFFGHSTIKVIKKAPVLPNVKIFQPLLAVLS